MDGAEQIPVEVRYVPGGHGLDVVEISILLQVPSCCLTVPNGQVGCAVVVGVEHVPDAVK